MVDDFDTKAATWDTPEKVERSRRIAEAIAARVPLHDDWTALDAGAGTGQLGLHLGGRLRRVVLVDTSAGMLEVARRHTADDPERYSVRRLDLTAEPLGEQVDLVISAMTLHHVPDTAAMLAAFRETLAPGGWVALADLDADPDNGFHDDDYTGHRGIDRTALVADLRGLGFEDVAATTATTVEKTKHGTTRRFTVFLVTGHLPA